MNAQVQAASRSISIDADRLDQLAGSPRTKFALAQVLMVAGYLSFIGNPFDDDAMQLGLLCQAVALLLYVSSKMKTGER